MIALRVVLSLILATITAYTGVVVWNHGMGLLSIFFGDMARMAWPGQFNLDFLCMLILSGLWVAWRQRFRWPGILLGVLAVFGGALFLSGYLIVESSRVKGGLPSLLLGENGRHS